MAKRGYSFSDKFPHFKLFLFIAVLIAFPLTVWSVQKVPTNTEQEAAMLPTYATWDCSALKCTLHPAGSGLGKFLDEKSCNTARVTNHCIATCDGKPYIQVWENSNYTGATNIWCARWIIKPPIKGYYYTLEVPYVGDFWNDHINSVKMINWPGNNEYSMSFYFNSNYKDVYTGLSSYFGIPKTQNIPNVQAIPHAGYDGISSFKSFYYP